MARRTLPPLQAGRVMGSYTAEGPGMLMLCWDNTYSIFTPKYVSYRVQKEGPL